MSGHDMTFFVDNMPPPWWLFTRRSRRQIKNPCEALDHAGNVPEARAGFLFPRAILHSEHAVYGSLS